MSDFLERINIGRTTDTNKGLLTGLTKFDKFTYNLQKETYTVIGAMKKVGKTAFLDFRYVLMPYLLNPNANIKWFYFSFEISRIKKMAKFASFLIFYKYGKLINPSEIMSVGDKKLSDEDYLLVEEVYKKELVALFGEWNKQGKLIKEGKITFIEEKTNPTGIRVTLLDHFYKNGEIMYTDYEIEGAKKKRMTGYRENDPSLYTIIITDHVGLLKKEQGFNKKDNIDKFSEFMIEMRNTYKATVIATSQFNRDLSKIDRLKFSGDQLTPTAEDFKDTGNLAEDATVLITLFNPYAYKHLKKHLGYELNKLDKKYVSLHLLESRDTEGFVDLGLNFIGSCGFFKELPYPEDMTNSIYQKVQSNQFALEQ